MHLAERKRIRARSLAEGSPCRRLAGSIGRSANVQECADRTERARPLLADGVSQARKVVAKSVGSAAEGEQIPREGRGLELSRLQALVVHAQLPANRRGRVDDNHGCSTGVRIDVDESVEPDVEAAFFARFADGRG